jgi:hypothetical protein
MALTAPNFVKLGIAQLISVGVCCTDCLLYRLLPRLHGTEKNKENFLLELLNP